MKALPVAGFRGWACLFLLLFFTYAQGETTAKKQFDIGFVPNRPPHTYLGGGNEPKGLLINILDRLCGKLNINCVYVSGSFNQLLAWSKAYRLNLFVVLDAPVPAELEKDIKLTSPLCKFEPVFILRKDNLLQDFAGATIGVGSGSLMHLYLLDKYQDSHLRPYFTLENGIFDLVAKRIDAFFTDKAFFQAKAAMTALGDEAYPDHLVAREIDGSGLSATAMRLAVREGNTELLAMFEEAIQGQGKIQPCSGLPSNR